MPAKRAHHEQPQAAPDLVCLPPEIEREYNTSRIVLGNDLPPALRGRDAIIDLMAALLSTSAEWPRGIAARLQEVQKSCPWLYDAAAPGSARVLGIGLVSLTKGGRPPPLPRTTEASECKFVPAFKSISDTRK